jgi:hypothetical protein
MAGQRKPPRGRKKVSPDTLRRGNQEILEVTESSDVSFADAASKAFEKGRKIGKDKKNKTLTYAEIVKSQIVAGSTQYLVTLRFPEY